MTRGRKGKYNEDMPKWAEKYAREGLNDEQIAPNLGIHKETYYVWQKKYPEFFDAIKRGRQPINFQVENNLLKKIRGYDYEEEHTEYTSDENGNPRIKEKKIVKRHVPPSDNSIKFWLTNREPERWRDKREHEHSGHIHSIIELLKEEDGKDSENETNK